MRDLLTLYKLLWEQIKDKNIIALLEQTGWMQLDGIVTIEEMSILDDNIILEKDKLGGFVNSKYFVQRRIKELENENTNRTC